MQYYCPFALPSITHLKIFYLAQVPSANAVFFCGDRIEGTGNPVIERLSDLQKISETLVSKFGPSINAWVIEASAFNGPFAVYKEFIPSVNQYGEPKSYSPIGFPASTSTVSLLSNFLEEVCLVLSPLLTCYILCISGRYLILITILALNAYTSLLHCFPFDNALVSTQGLDIFC